MSGVAAVGAADPDGDPPRTPGGEAGAAAAGDPAADVAAVDPLAPGPEPDRPWVIRMVWTDLLFAHWGVDPALVEPLLPRGVRLETRGGQAWVGAVPFAMDIRPRLVPPLGPLTSFLELNLRTYVTVGGVPGVWFFSLDTERRLAVWAARRYFHLPYHHAVMSLRREGGAIRYASRRTGRGPGARFRAVYGPTGAGPAPSARDDAGEARHGAPDEPASDGGSATGPLSRWLTARYRLYASDGDRIYRTEVRHPPWPLREAAVTVEENTLGDALGLPLDGQPAHSRFSPRLEVRCWTAEEVRPP